MGKVVNSVRVADRAINTLLNVQEDESVLIVADESAMENSQEIIEALRGLAIECGAETSLITMEDAGILEVELYLPETVKNAMEGADVLIGISETTPASFTHHEFPMNLRWDGQLRSLGMTQRTYEDLTSSAVLDVDYHELASFAEGMRQIVDEGETIRVTSDIGTDLTASIEGMPSKCSDLAHDPGDLTIIGWGEVYQGPAVGTTNGTAVIDGAVSGYGFPDEDVELEIEDGNVVDITGDRRIVSELTPVVENNENAENIAEIAFGINPHANRESTTVWKKGRGRVHIGIGNGLIYDQPVDSEVHIDFIMNEPSVEIDGETIIENGEYTV